MAITRFQMKERRRCIRKIERAIEKLQELTGLGSVLDGCDGTEIEMNKVEGFIGDLEEYREYMDEMPEIYQVTHDIKVLRRI